MYERVAELPEDFADVRDNLLDRYSGKNLEGLDIGQVEDYLATNDLNAKPYVVVTPQDVEMVEHIDKVGTLRSLFSTTVTEGVYSPEIGMSVILRSQALEDQNGTAYTEGLIVHEAAHSTADISQFARERGTQCYLNTRSGFAIPQSKKSSGFIFEEGWADFHRGNYLGQHFSDGSLAKVVSAADWSKGPDETVTIDLNGRQTPLPFKYLKIAEDGRLTSLRSTLAAFSVELLVRADPDIYTAMQSGRTEAAGLRDLSQRVNALSNGLYPSLRKLDYSEDDFGKGLHTVIDDVIGGSELATR